MAPKAEDLPEAGGLTVFYGLEEMTLRIPRLSEKPYERLIAEDGAVQPEILIFEAEPYGTEVWSYTFELCKDLANIERRPGFNCDGSIASFVGNRTYRGTDGTIVQTGWAGHNYLMRPDGSGRKKLIVTAPDGTKCILAEKFNTWDRKDPNALYATAIRDGDKWRSWQNKDREFEAMWLVRVRLDAELNGSMELLYEFPNKRRKLIQNISETNVLVVQDVNANKKRGPDGKRTKEGEYMPLYYVIDLNREPGEEGFARSHTLGYGIEGVEGHELHNEHWVHGITISPDGKRVRWNYGPMTSVGEYVGFSVPADDLDAEPAARQQKSDPWGQYQSHPGTWIDGRKAYFSGPNKITREKGIEGGWGIWVRFPDKAPDFLLSASGGHITWCGQDPDWFFANTSRREDWKPQSLQGKMIAGCADGERFRVLCDPYDRQRGSKKDAGYDGIPRPNQSPDATKCWYHSSMLMPDNKHTGSFVAVFRRPHPPTALRGEAGNGTLRLTWTPHALANEVKGYRVYGRKGEAWKELTETAVKGSAFDAPVGFEAYGVTAEEHSGLESGTTSPLVDAGGKPAGAGVAGFDAAAPDAPGGLSATQEDDGWLLAWEPSPSPDVRYYNLYCGRGAKPEAVQARRFASPPAGTLTLLDWSGPKDGAHYAITAVDRQGNESEPVFAPE